MKKYAITGLLAVAVYACSQMKKDTDTSVLPNFPESL
jgi:hypothetical protein